MSEQAEKIEQHLEVFYQLPYTLSTMINHAVDAVVDYSRQDTAVAQRGSSTYETRFVLDHGWSIDRSAARITLGLAGAYFQRYYPHVLDAAYFLPCPWGSKDEYWDELSNGESEQWSQIQVTRAHRVIVQILSALIPGPGYEPERILELFSDYLLLRHMDYRYLTLSGRVEVSYAIANQHMGDLIKVRKALDDLRHRIDADGRVPIETMHSLKLKFRQPRDTPVDVYLTCLCAMTEDLSAAGI